MKRIEKGHIVMAVLICLLSVVHAEQRGVGGKVRVDGTWVKREDVEEIGDYYALIIAVDRYGPAEWRLRTPVKDGKALAKVLKDQYGFKDIIELYDDEATVPAIKRAIAKLAEKAGKRDSVLIYFAGHGQYQGGTGYWIPANAKPREWWNWLEHILIRDMIKMQRFPARHVLVVSDSCYSAALFRSATIPAKVVPEYVRRAMRTPARQCLTSGGLAPVADGGGGEHSVFARYFLKCLKNPPRDVFVPSDIMPDLKQNVGDNAPAIKGERQVPILGVLTQAGGERGGEFVFVRRAARTGTAIAKSADTARIEALIAATRVREEDLRKAKELYEQIEALEKAGAPVNAAGAATRAKLWRQYIDKFELTDYRIADAKRYLANNRAWRPAATTDVPASDHSDRPSAGPVKKRSEDGRFTLYESGVIWDSKNKIEWLVGPDKDTNYDEAVKWVKACKVAGGNWRMPTRDELKSLYAKGRGTRNMDPVFDTSGSWVWSGDMKDSGLAWGFGFGEGGEDWDFRGRSVDSRVFAVRQAERKAEKAPDGIGEAVAGESSLLGLVKKRSEDGRFTLYESGVIYDSKNKIEWLVGPDKDTGYEEAVKWVKACKIAGGNWRMPTRDELKSLYVKGGGTRNMDPVFETTGWFVWSGEAKDSSKVWSFYFGFGNEVDSLDFVTNHKRVFAVRPRKPGRSQSGGAAIPEWARVSKEQIQYAEKTGLSVAKELDLGGGVKMRLVLIPPGEFMMGSKLSPEQVVQQFRKYYALKPEYF